MRTSTSETGEVILPHHLERVVAICAMESSDAGRLAGLATALGWSGARQIRVGSGPSAALQRLRAEVARGRIGLVLCASVDKLLPEGEDAARFLDLCVLYDTLVGDLRAIYDPQQPEDRRAMGLVEGQDRGLEQRLRRGRLRKARRGALGVRVPTGYLRGEGAEVLVDPDPAVAAAVRGVFSAFEARGAVGPALEALVSRGGQLGFRGADGALEWRAPNRQTLRNILRNPIYAGAYVYGRRPELEPNAPGAWKVCLRDHHPAYLSWADFERNVERLSAGRGTGRGARSIRRGAAMLSGLVRCGRCGRRMVAQYPSGAARYVCPGERHAPSCQSLAARTLDGVVVAQARAALEPSALEARLERAGALSAEALRRGQQLQARLDWSREQADIAERRYLAVDPDNIRVASTLEAEWEGRLRALHDLEREREGWTRRHEPGAQMDRAALTGLVREASGWEALGPERRKWLIRQVIEQVEVSVEGETERVGVGLHWSWGEDSALQVARPVARWEQMSCWTVMVEKLRAWKSDGVSAREIAARLNAEGWQTPRLKGAITPEMIRSLLSRHRITAVRRGVASEPGVLGADEWWLPELARELEVPASTLYGWLRRGRLSARQLHGDQGRWVIAMDDDERRRLIALRDRR